MLLLLYSTTRTVQETQVSHCDLFSYVDNSTLLKVIPIKDDIMAADELNADLRTMELQFISVTHSVCPLRRMHPLLFMDVFRSGYIEDFGDLFWQYDRSVGCSLSPETRCLSFMLETILASDYFGQKGLTIAFKSFCSSNM